MSREIREVVVYTCDHFGCKREARAGSEELLKEWRKSGQTGGLAGMYLVWHWCPDHTGEYIF